MLGILLLKFLAASVATDETPQIKVLILSAHDDTVEEKTVTLYNKVY